MEIVEVLEKLGRMELVELASLFLKNSASMADREELMLETGEDDCGECAPHKPAGRGAFARVVVPAEVD